MTARSQRRPEAEIEVAVLKELGRVPDLLVCKNEVGVFYRETARAAVAFALRPFGREAVAAALDALSHHRQLVGLGVGSPDLVLSVAGRAAGLELKSEDGSESEQQFRWHAAARRRGMFVASPVRSVEEAAEAVERCRRGASE